MTTHDWIAVVSIVVVTLGGIVGGIVSFLLKRTIDRLDSDVERLSFSLRTESEERHKLALDAVRRDGEVKAAQALAERVEEALGRVEEKLDRALGLKGTPPHGIARAPRD